MIVKAAIIGAILGGISGFFVGGPLQMAVFGAVIGIVVRKKIFGIFWK